MKKFSVQLKIFKYSNLRYREEVIFYAKNIIKAKNHAKTFIASTNWALDLTPIPDLRTVKQIR